MNQPRPGEATADVAETIILILESESDLDRDLPVGDPAVLDLAARFQNFKPPEVAQRLGGL